MPFSISEYPQEYMPELGTNSAYDVRVYSLMIERERSKLLNKPKGGFMGLFKNLILKKSQKYAEQDLKNTVADMAMKPAMPRERYHVDKYTINRFRQDIQNLKNSVRLLRVAAGVKEVHLSLKKLDPDEQQNQERNTERLSPAKSAGLSEDCDTACC